MADRTPTSEVKFLLVSEFAGEVEPARPVLHLVNSGDVKMITPLPGEDSITGRACRLIFRRRSAELMPQSMTIHGSVHQVLRTLREVHGVQVAGALAVEAAAEEKALEP